MSLILSHFVLTPALLTHTFDSSHFPPSDLRKHIGYVKEKFIPTLVKNGKEDFIQDYCESQQKTEMGLILNIAKTFGGVLPVSRLKKSVDGKVLGEYIKARGILAKPT